MTGIDRWTRPRFEAKYSHEPNSGCWLWTAHLAGGYGQMTLAGGKQVSAHRLSWILHRGAIPDGLFVLHRCDTPACVNPDHLFLGTNRDNYLDCVTKGRAAWQRWPSTGPKRGPLPRQPNGKRSYRCSQCLKNGHQSRTCKLPLHPC